MWQANGQLIQVELGSNIVDASTEPDQRGWIGKLFGESPPETGRILVDITQRLRNYLCETEGILLPIIQYRDNPAIQPDQVHIFIGLTTLILQVENLDAFFNYLVWKVREYNNIPSNKSSIERLLDDSLIDIKRDDYNYAFEKIQKAYYHSCLQDYEFERIRCLSDSGNIRLINGSYLEAISLFTCASQLCNSPNIVDAKFKAQIGINTANVFRITNQLEQALDYYNVASTIAYYAGDSFLMFLGLIGSAEINYVTQNYTNALFALEQSINLIFTQSSPNYQIAFNLQRFMTTIYQKLLTEKQGTQELGVTSLFEEVKSYIISALIQSVIGAAVYKIFRIENTSSIISIFGKSNYNLKQSIFNAPTVIGERNIQNLR